MVLTDAAPSERIDAGVQKCGDSPLRLVAANKERRSCQARERRVRSPDALRSHSSSGAAAGNSDDRSVGPRRRSVRKEAARKTIAKVRAALIEAETFDVGGERRRNDLLQFWSQRPENGGQANHL